MLQGFSSMKVPQYLAWHILRLMEAAGDGVRDVEAASTSASF